MMPLSMAAMMAGAQERGIGVCLVDPPWSPRVEKTGVYTGAFWLSRRDIASLNEDYNSMKTVLLHIGLARAARKAYLPSHTD